MLPGFAVLVATLGLLERYIRRHARLRMADEPSVLVNPRTTTRKSGVSLPRRRLLALLAVGFTTTATSSWYIGQGDRRRLLERQQQHEGIKELEGALRKRG